jgi:hypothetical protein
LFLFANFICACISILLFLQDPTLFDTFLVVVAFSNISFYYFPTRETTLLNKFQFLVLVTNVCILSCFLIAMCYDSYFLGQEIDKHIDSPIFWLIDLLSSIFHLPIADCMEAEKAMQLAERRK